MNFFAEDSLTKIRADIALLAFFIFFALAFHDQLEKHMLVCKIVLPFIADDAIQSLIKDFVIEGDKFGGVGVEYFANVVGQVEDAHVEEVVPDLGVARVAQFLVAFLQENQAVLVVDVWQKDLPDEGLVEAGHPKVVGSTQNIDDEGAVIEVAGQEAHAFGLEVLDEKEVGVLGDPFGQGQRALGMGGLTSEVSLTAWESVSEARRSRSRR